MNFEQWMVFVAIWIAVSIPLGPNAVNCISASATHGFRKGLWSVVGVFIAALIHMTVALSGIATFLTTNPQFFEVLRWFGVGYLAWMGVSLLRSGKGLKVEKFSHLQSNSSLVRRAILVSLSNPKAIFIWLAVFTQFIDIASPLIPQLIILGPSALSITVVVYIGYCGLGLGVNKVFGGQRKIWFDRISGAVYLIFAAALGSADLRKN